MNYSNTYRNYLSLSLDKSDLTTTMNRLLGLQFEMDKWILGLVGLQIYYLFPTTLASNNKFTYLILMEKQLGKQYYKQLWKHPINCKNR